MNISQSMALAKQRLDVFYHISPDYLSHADEPVDFYRKYEYGGIRPAKGGRNARNLFADSDIRDLYWLKLAKKHLKMSSD